MNANRDLARFSLGGCNGGEPSAHVRFRTRCTWMQHTTLIRRGTTGRTRDGGDLFGGEFALPHLHKMRHPDPQVCRKLRTPQKKGVAQPRNAHSSTCPIRRAYREPECALPERVGSRRSTNNYRIHRISAPCRCRLCLMAVMARQPIRGGL
jgi:hypothetical protein